MNGWSYDNIPPQQGHTAVVTGANTGIGFETARMLALKGAHVVLACRNLEKGKAARDRIVAQNPAGSVAVAPLDLSDLESVSAFAADFARQNAQLDLLINNAGVMVPPLGRTKQGFELQFGTNHLGHFALTAHLLPLMHRTPGARAVILSSIVHEMARIHFEDLNWQRRTYDPWAAYGQSKLANLSFAFELQRRVEASGSDLRVTAAHPGWTSTDLQRTARLARFLSPLFAMKPPEGALPTLRAATDPLALGGTYWGPSGLGGIKGPPALARASARARDVSTAARLWEESEKLARVQFRFETADARPPQAEA